MSDNNANCADGERDTCTLDSANTRSTAPGSAAEGNGAAPDSGSVQAVKNKGGRPKGAKRGVNKLTQSELAMVVTDYARGLPQTEIAAKMGLSDSGVSQVLAKFAPMFAELGNVKEFREAKADVYDALQLQALKSMSDPDKHASATLRDLAVAADVLQRNSRLERGMSTNNLSVQTTVTVRSTLPDTSD